MKKHEMILDMWEKHIKFLHGYTFTRLAVMAFIAQQHPRQVKPREIEQAFCVTYQTARAILRQLMHDQMMAGGVLTPKGLEFMGLENPALGG